MSRLMLAPSLMLFTTKLERMHKMRTPESNGLFEVAGKKEKERGFTCMQLILFLTADDVKN